MAIAGLDLGKRRIGLAIADNEGLAVHPIGALERRSVVRDLELIRSRFVEFEVSRVVIGLPLNMDGTAGPASRFNRSAGGALRRTADQFRGGGAAAGNVGQTRSRQGYR